MSMRTLVAAVVAATLLIPAASAPPAAASSCPAPGGADLPPLPHVEGDFVIAGRGWGHGVGLSQYGAQGAALLGCDRTDILTTFYPNATVDRVAAPTPLRVSLATDLPQVDITDPAHDITWQACTPAGDCDPIAVQPAGSAWTATPQLDGWSLPDAQTGRHLLRADLDGVKVHVDDGNRTLRYDRGTLELERRAMDVDTDDPRAATYATIIAGVDDYLYGLGEVPASWPAAALQAQATAARTYALYKQSLYRGDRPGCRCDLYATVLDQNYIGYEKAAGDPDGRWAAAVDATGGDTVEAVTYDGRPIPAFYSSSSGGHTMSNADWGGSDLPYLPAIDVSAWEAASSNPYATWSATLTADEVAVAFDLDEVTSWSTPAPLLPGGRIGRRGAGHGGVVAVGPSGDRAIAGTALRSALPGKVRSNFFAVGVGTLGATPDSPPEPTLARTSGPNRFATAAQVAAAIPDPDTVVLASGRAFPDALVAGPLAGHLDAPILLTEPSVLPPETTTALQAARPDRLVVIGGPAAVDRHVVGAAARTAGIDPDHVLRLAGQDRFATARAVYDHLQDAGAIDGSLYVATGLNFPDALVASAAAARTSGAVALSAPDGRIPAFDGVVDGHDVQVVGGQTVNPALPDAPRLAGPDRYATATAVADHLTETANRQVLLATGTGFPDALASAPLAASGDTVLLLAHPQLLPETTVGHLRSGNVRQVLVVGGTAAISEGVAADAADAIGAS